MKRDKKEIDKCIVAVFDALNTLNKHARGLGQLTLLNAVEVDMHEVKKSFEEEQPNNQSS